MDTEGQIAILLEKIENLRIQQGRLMSHVDSEQRHTVRHGKDIDKLILKVETIEKHHEKHDSNWKYWIVVIISIGVGGGWILPEMKKAELLHPAFSFCHDPTIYTSNIGTLIYRKYGNAQIASMDFSYCCIRVRGLLSDRKKEVTTVLLA